MSIQTRVETWRLYAKMIAVPVTIYAPNEIFADLEETFKIYFAIRYENRVVTDAVVKGDLMTKDGIIETQYAQHITNGIYVIEFTDKNIKHGIVRLVTQNYLAEKFIHLCRSVVKPISELSKKILSNNWEIKNNQLIIYDDDGVTPLLVFNLYDKLGYPTELNVFKRVRQE